MPTYEREDWTLFRTLEGVCQCAGVPLYLLRRLVTKEIVDNALDVAGHCEVSRATDHRRGGPQYNYGVCVQDRGPGFQARPGAPMTPEEIARLFSFKRPLVSEKLIRLPTRGALGNGLRVVAGAVYASDGTLDVYTNGMHLALEPQDTGETRILCCEPWQHAGGTVTQIIVTLGKSVPMDHLDLWWGELACLFSGAPPIYNGKSSPYWYDTDSFFELLRAAKGQSVREVIEALDGCTGRTAGEIAAGFKGRPATSVSHEEAAEVLRRARDRVTPFNKSRLSFMGQTEAFELEDFAHAKTAGTGTIGAGRDGGLPAILPFTVEAWAKVRRHWQEDQVHVFVNRTPISALIFHRRGDGHDKGRLGIWGSQLNIKDIPAGKQSVELYVNLQIPFMPITSAGKAPNLYAFQTQIASVLTTALNIAKKRIPKDPDAPRFPKDVILDKLQSAIAQASGNGRYRYSLRQLFYAVRPHLLKAFSKEPNYGTFTNVITEYEREHGDLAGLYRDPRGTIYHPHLGEREIPLGTLAVEQYKRPEWAFNKILYSEKEGLLSILREERWPERHDCALLSAKGYGTRAARDVLDFLGETDEELTFYCIHDSDGPGTMIYQCLQEETKARPARKVKIVNLGMDPWEAREMEETHPDRIEPVSKEDRIAVANYVSPEDAEWLQKNRVELNAFTTEEFIEWLDGKMAEHVQNQLEQGIQLKDKVIPPEEVLSERLRDKAREHLETVITDHILREAKRDEQVDDEFTKMQEDFKLAEEILTDKVDEELQENPLDWWPTPVTDYAHDLVKIHLKATCHPAAAELEDEADDE